MKCTSAASGSRRRAPGACSAKIGGPPAGTGRLPGSLLLADATKLSGVLTFSVSRPNHAATFFPPGLPGSTASARAVFDSSKAG